MNPTLHPSNLPPATTFPALLSLCLLRPLLRGLGHRLAWLAAVAVPLALSKSGDRLQLFELVDLKDESGQGVFTEEKAVGEVLLDAVNEDRSKGHYTGLSVPRAGWTVKKS